MEKKVERTIRKYKLVRPGDRVLVAVSGGKDSAVLASILSELRGPLDYKISLIHVNLGIGAYSVESEEAAHRLASRLGVPLHVVRLEELTGSTVPQLAVRLRRPPCSVCGTVKRYILNAAAVEWGASSLATGHNADDIAVYALKSFLTQRLEDIGKLAPYQPPVEGLAAARIKPLYTLYEWEAARYASIMGLPVVSGRCPHATPGTLELELKEIINRLEERHPSLKAGLVTGIARRLGDYPRPQGRPSACSSCGLISMGGECGFCKMTGRALGAPLGGRVREYFRRSKPLWA